MNRNFYIYKNRISGENIDDGLEGNSLVKSIDNFIFKQKVTNIEKYKEYWKPGKEYSKDTQWKRGPRGKYFYETSGRAGGEGRGTGGAGRGTGGAGRGTGGEERKEKERRSRLLFFGGRKPHPLLSRFHSRLDTAKITGRLELHNSNTSDISALSALTNLEELNLGKNNISDISALAGLSNLEKLYLNDTNIGDISALAGLTNLESLDLTGNPNITDISSLADLTNLDTLYLENNNISDISALAGKPKLEVLTLGRNNVSDISPLANLGYLEFLDLEGNNISDISPLVENTRNAVRGSNRGLAAGDVVYLGGNPLSEKSKNVYIPQLEERGIDVSYDD